MRVWMSRPGKALLRATLFLCLAAGLALDGCAPPPPPAPLFYPPLPQRPRIQFLRQLNTSRDVEAPASSFRAFVLGKVAQENAVPIMRPYGMAMGDGKLYVADSGGRRIAVLDLKGRRFSTFGDKGMARLRTPINLCIGPDGDKYVCDTALGAIMVFDRDNKFARMLRREEGMKPSDALLIGDELFVADLKSNGILVLDPKTGRLLRQFGKGGKEPGEFYFPTNLAVDSQGRIYVSDTMNARVQVVDKSGKFIKAIGERGILLGNMVRPKGVALDREGRLYVADAAPQTVQIYDPEGHLLLMLGAAESDVPDQGTLTLPAKVMISYEGVDYFTQFASPDFKLEYLIFVSSQFAQSKVTVYGFGKYLKPLPASAGEEKLRVIKVTPPKEGPGAEKPELPPEEAKEPPSSPPAPKEEKP